MATDAYLTPWEVIAAKHPGRFLRKIRKFTAYK
ncbi:rCG19944, partial [Rattus norvegicus]